jgi:hypothetical protein
MFDPRKWIALVALALLVVWGSVASASVILVDNTFPATLFRGTMSCDLSCEGLVGDTPTVFSSTAARLYDLPDSSKTTELAWVNGLTGESFLSGTKTTAPGGNLTFTSAALYILIKIGRDPNVTLFKNTSGAPLTLSWVAEPGTGGGLSHFTEFGQVSPIPLPAALPLLAGGLGMLGWLGRRKKRAPAA